ncbi:TonB-dependent receptor [Zhongshania aquimaris]|uniref:TonB-dependent receptor n=1 Tax=Zhongshania aquimaris TaxID=2857107 RepID=A0ABS6VWL9_9GAMM|nr:TonB-dependent receptor [Zhongshania aquimaris]MBW2942747.1 TonB-dependent receptor [Zhongshania aquimaris]
MNNKIKQKIEDQHHFSRSALFIAMAAIAAPTYAQTSAAGAAGPAAGEIEEVMVTARRKDESLAKVPIAVSAIGAEQMTERQIKTDSDLQIAVPGLTIRQTQGNNSLTYSIRGQSADTFSGSPSAVVAYINEVPLTISGASTFYDLESVQVLKGPQGTLFGRNTTGGAVLYTTAKPSNENEALLRVRAGNYDMREFEGVVNVPIVDDKILFRAAANSIRRDGYIDNLTTGEEHGELGRDTGRLTLTLRPSDRLENTTLYSYARVDGTNTGATYVYSIYQAGQTNNGYALNTASSFLASSVDDQKAIGYYKTRHPYGADHIGEDEVFINTTTYELGDGIQLKNILGYTSADTDSEQPALGAAYATFATRNLATGRAGNEVEVDSLSNEFQISGEAVDGKLTYIAGLYIQDMRVDTLWPQTYFEGAQNATNNFRIDTETAALYAQASYSLSSALRATAGLRYTQEKVSIEQLAESDYNGVAGFAQKQDETFEEPSWELGLEYDLSDSTFTYLKTRGSFRSGGFNGSAPPVNATATGGGNKFEKESVQDVEAGLKYQGSVLDRPARLNLAVYQQWVEDVQRIEFPSPPPGTLPGDPPSIAVTANVPEMEVRGIEIEASIMPLHNLELGVVGAYTDAEFTDGETELFGTTYSYSPVANTPKTTWGLWAQVDILNDAHIGDIGLRADAYRQAQMYFSNSADSLTPDTKLPGYTLVNLRLSWANIFGSKLSGAVFGKNVLDEEYFVGGMPLGASLGHNAAAVGEPAMYGVEVSYQF